MESDLFYLFWLVLKNKEKYDKIIDDKFSSKLNKAFQTQEYRKNFYKMKLNQIIEKSETEDDLNKLLENL